MKGEPLALKNTLNSLADSLTHLASEVTNLTCNVVQGKYGGSVVVPGARGSWKDIADNVNFIMSTFEGIYHICYVINNILTQSKCAHLR